MSEMRFSNHASSMVFKYLSIDDVGAKATYIAVDGDFSALINPAIQQGSILLIQVVTKQEAKKYYCCENKLWDRMELKEKKYLPLQTIKTVNLSKNPPRPAALNPPITFMHSIHITPWPYPRLGTIRTLQAKSKKGKLTI
ncbi:hypothetical protein COCMIDRAFT_25483 [Bipolaris oryzae ATCC 44560]|uniref:Uncharacterized protein n=1 Tax=Bipolaris oryzae ATCC 44560 TaxID=930090 RepID=W6ZS51_COCMI|nr:uncharacterized protein COCMIDRAFT_25483 [Bipolaris oryzae ATCC 44560]EUC46526.1 hypothetical protein COCMIDRAFT_25483 [Bipolaris oryzae ATCC 44560]